MLLRNHSWLIALPHFKFLCNLLFLIVYELLIMKILLVVLSKIIVRNEVVTAFSFTLHVCQREISRN